MLGSGFRFFQHKLHVLNAEMNVLKKIFDCGYSTSSWLSGNAKSAFNSSSTDKGVVVAVEGNIGCGKTRLLEYFSGSPHVQTHQEPVNRWRNINGSGINGLDHMYREPGRWVFAFQVYVQMTLVDQHRLPQREPVKMMERSVFSSRYIFAENWHRRGTMHEMDFAILQKMYDLLTGPSQFKLDLIVYLRTDPAVVHERIKKRGRNEENTISLEYLRELHELHEELFLAQSDVTLPAPVLILDANKGLEEMLQEYELRRKDIMCGVSYS